MRRPRLMFHPRRFFLLLCASTLLITVWLGTFLGKSHSTAYAIEPAEQVKIGVEHYQAGDFAAALDAWHIAHELYKTEPTTNALAIVSENIARAYQQMGQTTEEIDYWEQAITATQSLGEPDKLSQLLSEQAQAYSRLGQHRRAIALLCGSETAPCLPGTALQLAETTGDTIGQFAALGSLGEAYRLSGDAEKALDYLEQARQISEEANNLTLTAAIFNSLGNTSTSLALINYRRAEEAENKGDQRAADTFQAEANQLNADAISAFQQSCELAQTQTDTAAQVRSLLNLIPAYERVNDLTLAAQSREIATQMLETLPNSQTKAFALIQLADFLDPLEIRQSQTLLNSTPPANAAAAIQLLEQAVAIGEAIENPRVESFAYGKLGQIEERLGRYENALERTQEARLKADQDLAARDSLYLWEWQSGRILQKQGKSEASTQAYRQAVELLEQIRSDILNANRDLQFDFRDTVEPVYRQFAELNLKEVPGNVPLQAGEPAFVELNTALTTLDSLKVAELQSYFANDCVIVPSETRVDEVGDSQATAVFSTALLENALPSSEIKQSGSKRSGSKQNVASDTKRLAVILSLPDGSKKIAQTTVSETEFREQIGNFRRTMEAGIREVIFEYDYTPSQRLYDWIIRPFETDLAGVETVVFVNDGLLRNVPMAALHDGENYLIEKYAIATTPSLTLTDPERIERPTQLSALLMGVSEQPEVPGQFFSALPAVEQELTAVSQQLPNNKVLKNQDFSLKELQQALHERDYRILHMATHGTFGFGTRH